MCHKLLILFGKRSRAQEDYPSQNGIFPDNSLQAGNLYGDWLADDCHHHHSLEMSALAGAPVTPSHTTRGLHGGIPGHVVAVSGRDVCLGKAKGPIWGLVSAAVRFPGHIKSRGGAPVRPSSAVDQWSGDVR